MRIGIAIPCYDRHVANLLVLLDSIDSQTILPDKVAISCSSCPSALTREIQITKYRFEAEIHTTEEKKNAAQNRNEAVSRLLGMDYITFIDADDIMHPQRIEMLLQVIRTYDSDIILHNYQTDDDTEFSIIDNVRVRTDSLGQSPSGCITQYGGYDDTIDKIHHSQVTVKRWILDVVRFPEEIEFNRKEDSVFCHRVFGLPHIKHAYILNKLSYYRPSYSIF